MYPSGPSFHVLLHPLIPLFDVLYTRGSGELWFYDEFGNFVLSLFCKRGVRQGCVLGTTIRCIIDKHVYDALRDLVGPKGFMFSYADDVYMGVEPVLVALTLTTAPCIYVRGRWPLAWLGAQEDGTSPPDRV